MTPRKSGSIGTNLRRLRLAAGLTQEGLAEAADVANATISRIERGRLVPSLKLAERLATALGKPVGALTAATTTAAPNSNLRPAERRLVAAVRGLDEARVDDVTRAVKLVLAAGRTLGR